MPEGDPRWVDFREIRGTDVQARLKRLLIKPESARGLFSHITFAGKVFSHASLVEKLVLQSGGSLRELMRLIQEACPETMGDRIDAAAVEKAVVNVRAELTRPMPQAYLAELAKIHKSKQTDNTPDQRSILFYFSAGNQVKAVENLAKVLSVYREIGDRLGEANTLRSLRETKRLQETYAEAEQLYSKAFEIYASIDDKYSQGATLLSLAAVYRGLGIRRRHVL